MWRKLHVSAVAETLPRHPNTSPSLVCTLMEQKRSFQLRFCYIEVFNFSLLLNAEIKVTKFKIDAAKLHVSAVAETLPRHPNTSPRWSWAKHTKQLHILRRAEGGTQTLCVAGKNLFAIFRIIIFKLSHYGDVYSGSRKATSLIFKS